MKQIAELKQFSGILNSDDDNLVTPNVHHKMAFNGRFRGNGANNRFEVVEGNSEVVNSFLPNTGTNLTVHAFFDSVKGRIFVFNHNSGGKNGIYIYTLATGTWARLAEVGAATDGDILGFSTACFTSAYVIYGDPIDGDILIYLDNQKRLTQINIDKFLNDPYTVTKRLFIDLAKAPPIMPPQVTYENDDTVTINNLKNSLFQFAEVFVFDSNETSLLSTGSIVPLPLNPFSTISDTDVSKNSRISVYLQTGDDDVKQLNLYGRQTKDGITSDWFLIATIDKAQLSIADNDVYRYEFLNDGLYDFADKRYAETLQDYVPIEANTLEILNGNVPIVGGITEGFDLPEPNVASSVSTVLLPYSTFNGLLFFASQTGLKTGGTGDTIILYLTGTGMNTSGMVSTLDNAQAIFKVDAQDEDGNSIGFQYDNTLPTETVTNIFDGLSTAAVAQGWTESARTTNAMTLTFSADVVLLGNGTTRDSGATFSDNDAAFVYAHESNQSFGIDYIDKNGRVSSTLTDVPCQIKTPAFSSSQLPLIQFEISHRPPIDAVSYNIVRSHNLTYNKRLFWVSFAAYEGVTSITNERFAYIDIKNIFTYNEEIKATSGVVSYDFTPGDRVRFLARCQFDGTQTPLSGKDYEIMGMSTEITLTTAEKKVGQFLQIKYPSNDIDANFKFDGSFDFSNYYILIYNYTQHTSQSQTTYFEFGKQFGIGNAGTNTAYHIGQEQTQSTDLVTPAIITTFDGDYIYKKRKVPIGTSYTFVLPGYTDGWIQYTVIPINLETSPITETPYIISTEVFANAGLGVGDYPTAADPCFFENTSGATIRVRIRFNYNFTNDVPMNDFAMYAKLVNNPVPLANVIVYQIYPHTGHLDENVSHTIEIDSIIDVPAGSKLSFINYRTDAEIVVAGSPVYFDVLQDASIVAIEKSFSDVYAIKTDSDSRANVVDIYAKKTFKGNIVRWGLANQQGTNLNNINRFYGLNFDEIDLAKGDILRFMVEGRLLYCYQTRGVGYFGVYSKFIQDSTGQNIVTTTDEIITQNNIQYLQGEYGLGNHPESLVRGRGVHYFIDPIRGYQVRRGHNGLEAISELYKGQFYIRGLLIPYNKTWTTSGGYDARLTGYYDYFEEQYTAILQGGTSGLNTISDYAFSFNEKRNGYCSFYDYHPEWILCAEDETYSFLNGKMYKHNNTTNYANFYGVQNNPNIILVFNDKAGIKKIFDTLSYQSNQFFVAPTNGDINTSVFNEFTGFQQISQLKSVDFTTENNNKYAAFLKDANSGSNAQIAVLEGDELRGQWIEVKLTYQGSNFAYLYLPYILYQIDQRNY